MRAIRTVTKAADASNGDAGMFFGILIAGVLLAVIIYIVVKATEK